MAQTRALFFALVLAICMVGCGGSEYKFGSTQRLLTSMSVTPAAQTLTATGQTTQFIATGNYSAAPPSQDLTAQAQWSSSAPSVVTVSSAGIATSVGIGTATITATSNGVTGSANITVDTSGQHTLESITVIPGDQKVQVIGETAQYIAIGNFNSAPTTQDMTSQVTWVSSDVRVAIINSSGLATAIGSSSGDGGQTTITAIAPPNTGVAVTGTATMEVSSNGTNQLPSLTVYEFGQGTGNVVSSPIGITCVPGNGAGCTGHFVLGNGVVLTAVPLPGSVFGGWSSNCTPPNAPLTGGSCTVTMTDNATVGAIFNQAP